LFHLSGTNDNIHFEHSILPSCFANALSSIFSYVTHWQHFHGGPVQSRSVNQPVVFPNPSRVYPSCAAKVGCRWFVDYWVPVHRLPVRINAPFFQKKLDDHLVGCLVRSIRNATANDANIKTNSTRSMSCNVSCPRAFFLHASTHLYTMVHWDDLDRESWGLELTPSLIHLSLLSSCILSNDIFSVELDFNA
jgi:hypothetical protein